MGNRLNRVVRGCLEADINPVECKFTQAHNLGELCQFIYLLLINPNGYQNQL